MAAYRSRPTPRSYRRKRTSTNRRTYVSKKRTYRKRTYRKKPAMSKRRILNAASMKKRNGMLPWTNTTTAGTSQTTAPGNVFINGATGGYFLWSPTAMDLNASASRRNPAQRSASTIYAKGLSEHVRIQTNTGVPWFHRRICFTTRGVSPFNQYNAADTPINGQASYVDTSNGLQRLFLNSYINNSNVTLSNRNDIIFKGTNQQDWTDTIIAPLDTSRIDVKFDKTWTMQSGNSNGVVRERKLWHPMNKNLVYDEDESGENQTSSYFSTDSKAGMGDYYVLDIFSAGAGGTAADVMLMSANSTMYWHER